ncbi:hypothetical protein GJ496_007973 [Pomphorhynchus laevis]|nr:hypothetical protein GJ496_007973 [Pomphorhynchus laevis]
MDRIRTKIPRELSKCTLRYTNNSNDFSGEFKCTLGHPLQTDSLFPIREYISEPAFHVLLSKMRLSDSINIGNNLQVELIDIQHSDDPSTYYFFQEYNDLLNRSEQYKHIGNNTYKIGDFKTSLWYYQNAVRCRIIARSITDDPLEQESISTVYSNIAACQFKLANYEHCIFACNESLRLCPSNLKARCWKGLSLDKLGKWGDAYEDFNFVLKKVPLSTLSDEIRETYIRCAMKAKQSDQQFAVGIKKFFC